MSPLRKGLSESEIRIIRELSLDASQTSEQLARKLGLAASTIRQKIAKMLKSGTVCIIGVPNPSVINYQGWAVMGINATPDGVENIIHELTQFDAIYTIASSFGRFDIIALAQFASIDEIQVFVKETLPQMTGFKDVEVFVLTRPRKYHGVVWEN